MTKDKIKISLVIIVILLIGFIIGMFVIKPAIERRDGRIYNQGIQYTIAAIMQEAATCNIIPLTFNNQTINIIAVDCLNTESVKE